ncbi:hypothetical protein [Inediibacterium massiliense]|uniref:hypothetical protein n=1 Tax=Inediibacterium massiliense TaxID=1658111 RepID=UPI0006B623FB|nr:hypothetical protein [Inediibacterium massiliense]
MIIVEKLLAHFIETFLMLGAGLGALGIRLKFKQIMGMGIVFSPIIYGIREIYVDYKIPFGTHIFILFICFILLIRFIGKQRILDSIIAGLISFSLLLWGEGFFFLPMLKVFNLNPTTLMFQPGGTLLGGVISNILLIIVFFIGYVLKITLIDFSYFHNYDK